MLDRQSAVHVSVRVQEMFFMMAVSNSCMNPLVYGSYALDLRGFFSRLLKKVFCLNTNPLDIPGMWFIKENNFILIMYKYLIR